MSTESKKFWQDYIARNGSVDVPELLDLYAAHLESTRLEPIESLAPEPPKPAPLSIDEMRQYCLDWCEGLGLKTDLDCTHVYGLRVELRISTGGRQWILYLCGNANGHLATIGERLIRVCSDGFVVMYYAMIHAIRNRLIP